MKVWSVEMNNSPAEIVPSVHGMKNNGCLSCGATENMRRRKYCSIECRKKLRHTLEIRTGLLKALNTRYATFYFTESVILLDVLPYGSKKIFSFIYRRSNGKKPAQDFSRLADLLGNAWWAEKRRTNKRYLASRCVFEKARRESHLAESLNPMEIKIPTIKGSALIYLKLGKSDLDSPELQKKIKGAFRGQAKKHHPDIGGDSVTFRKIQQAYETLINWAESPRFMMRRGFPDKWFYDGNKNRWVQPTPAENRDS